MKIEIDPNYQAILQEQTYIDETKITYTQLYTFATFSDWLLMAIGLLFAMVAGTGRVIFCELLIFILQFSQYTNLIIADHNNIFWKND